MGDEVRGKRQKKEVERYEVDAAPREHKELVIPAGKGEELGSIGAIEEMLQKIKSDHDLLRALHLVLYGVAGQRQTRKKDIRRFKGFAANDGVGLEKRQEKILDNKKWTVAALKDLCQLLCLEKSGDRETLVQRIMEFLDRPSASAAKAKSSGSVKKSKGASKGEKRKRKTKKEGGPKRTASSFMVFSIECRPKIKAKHPELSFTELAKKLGEMWREMKPAEKAKYEAKAAALKEPKKKASKQKAKKEAVEEDEEEEDGDEEEEEEEDDDDDGPAKKKSKGSDDDDDDESGGEDEDD